VYKFKFFIYLFFVFVFWVSGLRSKNCIYVLFVFVVDLLKWLVMFEFFFLGFLLFSAVFACRNAWLKNK